MNSEQLNKVTRLIRRTGDRCVVLDNESDEVMVMMRLKEYEDLLDAKDPFDDWNEKDMLNKIDRDIANWRARHDDDDGDSLNPLFDDWREREFFNDEDEDEETGESRKPEVISRKLEDDVIDETSEAKEKTENNFDFDNIGAERGTAGEEVSLNDVPQEEEEETFLLEPVE